jgi:hypothetical protein
VKFLIVLVSLVGELDQFKDVSVIAGPYSSLAICDQKLANGLSTNETLIRNNGGDLIKLAPDGHSFLKCIPYHPDW